VIEAKQKGNGALTKDPDRRAAKCVLSKSGFVKVNEEDKEICAEADLPREAGRAERAEHPEAKPSAK
jgi:hypothetical protein